MHINTTLRKLAITTSIALLTACCMSAVQAQSPYQDFWVDGDDGTRTFVDHDSIDFGPEDLVRFTQIQRDFDGGAIVTDVEVDCANRTIAWLYGERYQDGELVDRGELSGNKEQLIPGSTGYDVMRHVCELE